MKNKNNVLESIMKAFGPKPKTILEGCMNKSTRDIAEIRKNTDTSSNRIALDNAKKFLETVRDRASEYSREEVEVITGYVERIVAEISKTSSYSESMNTYIVLLVDYICKYTTDSYTRENASAHIEEYLRDAEIVFKNEKLKVEKEELSLRKRELREKIVKLNDKKAQALERIENAANDAEADLYADEAKDIGAEIKDKKADIESIEKKITVADDNIKNNRQYARHLDKIDFLKEMATTAAYGSIDEYRSAVEKASELHDEHVERNEEIKDIEKANRRTSTAKTEEDPDIVAARKRREQNQRDKATAQQDDKEFGFDTERKDIKNG